MKRRQEEVLYVTDKRVVNSEEWQARLNSMSVCNNINFVDE